MSHHFFVTGSGTDIGKTFVTCLIIRALRAQGKRIQAIKPVISGWDEADIANTDTGKLLISLGLPVTVDTIQRISPWRFAAPLSPHIAARLEGKEIDVPALLSFCQSMEYTADYVFAEGAGGVMVPVTDHWHSGEWMKALGWKAILVGGTYLGAISHTLTALTALEAYSVPVQAIIVNESVQAAMPLQEHIRTLQGFTAVPVIAVTRNAEKIDIAALKL